MTDELREDATAIVRAARDALTPTSAELTAHEARVLAAIRGIPGDAGAPTHAESLVTSATNTALAKKVWLALAFMAVGGGGYLFGASGRTDGRRESVPRTSSTVTRAEPDVQRVPAEATEAVAPAQDSVSAPAAQNMPARGGVSFARSSSSRSASTFAVAPPQPIEAPQVAAAESRLAQEVALVRLARSSLQSGAPNVALLHLDAHVRDFSDGVLAHESTLLRVRALCALGRADEARTLAPNDAEGAAVLSQACTTP